MARSKPLTATGDTADGQPQQALGIARLLIDPTHHDDSPGYTDPSQDLLMKYAHLDAEPLPKRRILRPAAKKAIAGSSTSGTAGGTSSSSKATGPSTKVPIEILRGIESDASKGQNSSRDIAIDGENPAESAPRRAETLHPFYDDPAGDVELVSVDGVVLRQSCHMLRKYSHFFRDLCTLPTPDISTRSPVDPAAVTVTDKDATVRPSTATTEDKTRTRFDLPYSSIAIIAYLETLRIDRMAHGINPHINVFSEVYSLAVFLGDDHLRRSLLGLVDVNFHEYSFATLLVLASRIPCDERELLALAFRHLTSMMGTPKSGCANGHTYGYSSSRNPNVNTPASSLSSPSAEISLAQVARDLPQPYLAELAVRDVFAAMRNKDKHARAREMAWIRDDKQVTAFIDAVQRKDSCLANAKKRKVHAELDE